MVKVPSLANSWLLVSECDRYRREPVAIAMILFYVEWMTQIGDPRGEVYNALNSLMVEFSDDEKRASVYDDAGFPIPSVGLSGLALSPGWVWVKSTHNQLLCETSLVHELVHIAIWSIKKTDGDPDHAGHKYWGWQVKHSILIQDVNQSLCELGL
jgi:hypothetical protein